MAVVAFRTPCHLVEGVSWCGEGSVGRRGDHLTAQDYIDVVLRSTVVSFLQQQPRGVGDQLVNVRLHTTRIVQNFLGTNNVNVLSWPACSSDMSPIDHLWDIVDLGECQVHIFLFGINSLRETLKIQ